MMNQMMAPMGQMMNPAMLDPNALMNMMAPMMAPMQQMMPAAPPPPASAK
jgi:hypothetical protein